MYENTENKDVNVHFNVADLLQFLDRGVLTVQQTRVMLQMSVLGWADSEGSND